MKWRSSSVAFVFLCGVFAVANSSPAGQKEAKEELEKKINPSISEDQGADEEGDDLLARAKKSSTVTTFCVEIKPGNDQPTVVVCDPGKNDHQLPIPSSHPLVPAPHHEPPSHHIDHGIPNLNPGYSPEYEHQPSAIPYEPLIFIPQQPQILQPQIISPYYPQPQIIFVRDPSCPSNHPTIIANPLQQLYSSKPFGKASQYGTDPANMFNGGFEGDSLRSMPGSNLAGMMDNQGFGSSPLNFIYPGRGAPQQNQPPNYVTVGQGSINGNLNPASQYDRPVLVQCNPSVTPLSPEAYAAALATGKANDPAFNPGMKTFPASEHSAQQYSYRPAGSASHGIHTTHGMHNANRYQPNLYGQTRPYNMQYRTMPGSDGQERIAEGTQGAVKTEQGMSTQQGQAVPDSFVKNVERHQQPEGQSHQHNSQSSFNVQGNHQGSVSGDGRSPGNQEQQQKMGSEKMGSEAGHNSENHFHPTAFSGGLNTFAKGDHMQPPKNIDQGFQKQMGFSHNQQQQKMISEAPYPAGSEQNHPQQATGKEMTYSQRLLQRMKSSVNQGNMVQPFMIPSSGSPGEKPMQSKL